MRPLLVIFAHSTVGETVKRHWPLYLNAGCDILGVGREDTVCQWPVVGGQFIGSINVGKESYADGDNHIRRFLDTLEHCLTTPALKSYGAMAFIEYDGVFFRHLPELKAGTLYAKLAGGNSPGFLGSMFLHTPWMFDRIMGGHILKAGRAMLGRGLIERGYLDRFFGLMIDLYDLQWRDTGASTYTKNTIEPCHYEEFKAAIDSGIWYAHGIKSAECLQVATTTAQNILHAAMAGQQNAEAVAALNTQYL